MPNKTNDWLDDLLDRHPAEPVPSGFAERVRSKLDSDQRAPAAPEHEHHETVIHRLAKPLLTMAAAALLVSIGFMMGAGQGPDYNTFNLGTGDNTADADREIEEIYQVRELLDSWELMSDEDLEMSFRQLNDMDSEWLDDLLAEPGDPSPSEGDNDGDDK